MDETCGDLPLNIIHEKIFVSATLNMDGTYDVIYNILVDNIGGLAGIYGLQDQPGFDDDVTINTASYTLNGGGVTSISPVGTQPWVLASGAPLNSGATDTYVLTVNVSLDITGAVADGGDDVYTECGTSSPAGGPLTGEGLYNQSLLDSDNDGNIDEMDETVVTYLQI